MSLSHTKVSDWQGLYKVGVLRPSIYMNSMSVCVLDKLRCSVNNVFVCVCLCCRQCIVRCESGTQCAPCLSPSNSSRRSVRDYQMTFTTSPRSSAEWWDTQYTRQVQLPCSGCQCVSFSFYSVICVLYRWTLRAV